MQNGHLRVLVPMQERTYCTDASLALFLHYVRQTGVIQSNDFQLRSMHTKPLDQNPMHFDCRYCRWDWYSHPGHPPILPFVVETTSPWHSTSNDQELPSLVTFLDVQLRLWPCGMLGMLICQQRLDMAGLFPMLICFFLIFSEFQTWQHLYNLNIFKNCPLTGLNPFELMTCLLVSIMSLILP